MRVRLEVVEGEFAWSAEVEDERRGYSPDVLADWMRLAGEGLTRQFAQTQAMRERLDEGQD